MSNMFKTFVINLVVFALVALTMYLMNAQYNSYIFLFKIWVWCSALILGYFIIVQVNNGKKLKAEREEKEAEQE